MNIVLKGLLSSILELKNQIKDCTYLAMDCEFFRVTNSDKEHKYFSLNEIYKSKKI